MRRVRRLLVVVALLAVTACSGADDGADTSAGTGSVSAEPPAAIPSDQQFTLDDQAEFPDGLLVEIAGSSAQKATKNVQGAESTGGQIVLASLRIENNTEVPYDPADVEVTAEYGDTPAPPVADPTNDLIVAFEGPIEVSDEGVASVGFAIPTSGLIKVTFVVDLHDDEHDPVSFTGKVEPAEG